VTSGKVKLFHHKDLELLIFGKSNVDDVLEELDCPVERMMGQEAAGDRRSL